MYHHTHLSNINKDANALPISNQRFMRRKSHENAFGPSTFDAKQIYYNEDDIVASNFLANEDRKQYRMNESQHTYGAYTNSTLPRGPYLQYKYNDRQMTNKYSLYNGRIDSISSSSSTIDNNNLQQKQIEQLKKEFFLPRVRVTSDDRQKPKTDHTTDTQLNSLRSDRAWYGSGDCYNYENSDENVKKDCINGAYNVQTLGRYKSTKSKKCTFLCDTVSNSEYFNSNDRYTNDKPDDIQPNYYNEQENYQIRIAQSKFLSKLKNDDLWPADTNTNNPKISTCQPFTNGTEIPIDALNKYSAKSTVPHQNANNLVFLSDIIKIKPNGLSQIEGWALLCQSVQALQDLFLSGKSKMSIQKTRKKKTKRKQTEKRQV